MSGTRLARNASAAVVAGIAAWSSYSHMVHVALRFGERPEVAWLLPFSVDGMLVVASVAMVDDKRSDRRAAEDCCTPIGVAAAADRCCGAMNLFTSKEDADAWLAVNPHTDIGDRIGQAFTSDGHYARHHLGQHDEAIACYRRALPMFQELGHRDNAAEMLPPPRRQYASTGDTGSAHDA